MSIIRHSVSKQGEVTSAVKHHSPLDCAASKAFWISWNEHEVQVGTGTSVTENVFLSVHNLTDLAVNAVAISTGWGSTGKWIFGRSCDA